MPESSASTIRTGIIIDACCDAPPEFLALANVMVIPISVKVGDKLYIDAHDTHINSRYMSENAQGQGANGYTEPMNSRQMQQFFLEHCALAYDQVYCLTVTSSVSEIYAAATQGLDMALPIIRERRHEANIHRPFVCRVVDCRNVFAAEGVAALLLQELLQQTLSPADMFRKLIRGIDNLHTYVLVDDLGYARKRVSVRGDHSLSLTSVILGETLNIKPIVYHRHGQGQVAAKIRGRNQALSKVFAFITEQINKQCLKTPHIIISHADALHDIYRADAFPQLRTACEVHGISLHILPMSITGMMNLGLGALTVAFAADIGDAAL